MYFPQEATIIFPLALIPYNYAKVHVIRCILTRLFSLTVKKTNEGWREVLIDLDEGAGEHHLRYVLSRGPTPASQFFIDVSFYINAD